MKPVLPTKMKALVATYLMLGFAFAEKDVVPNDPYFKYQVSFKSPGGEVTIDENSWSSSTRSLKTIKGIDLNVTPAWAITTGSKDVIVAILDDGFCYSHPDVIDNIWHNPGETGRDENGFNKETNNVDDDKNGYIDDVIGWDFVFESPDVDCHVFDGVDKTRIAPYWHSIDAMGIIGAKGNNGQGVAGINWNVSMMLLRIGVQGISRNEVDFARTERVVRAIHYAADNGARIINWSGFVSDVRPEALAELRNAIGYAASKNVLIVVGAGNDAKNLDEDENCTQAPECIDSDNLVKVAEIDFSGALFRSPLGGKWIAGSNYGLKRVDIAAIGMNYTTFVTRGGVGVYHLSGGTSNAAPVVSGVAALMLAVNSHLSAAQLKDALLRTAKRLPQLQGKVKSSGMVDAYAAVLAAKKERGTVLGTSGSHKAELFPRSARPFESN